MNLSLIKKIMFLTLIANILLGTAIAFTPVQSASAAEIDRAEIEKIIREYLLANPELMIEVQTALEEKQEAQRDDLQAETLSERADEIYRSKHQMVVGDPAAKITLVEFFDYNCSFCKRALDDMTQIISQNKDVKFVMKEFPVLGQASIDAHKVSLAVVATKPEIYSKFHAELLSNNGVKNGAIALDIATRLGADKAALEKAMQDPSIMEAFEEVYSLADGLGISGTPSYIVGDEVVFGAVGYDTLMPKIKNVRKCGKTEC